MSMPPAVARRSRLPRVDSPAYHIMLVSVALLVLGPLTGVMASYMNFSLGFYIPGQLLSGILGSAVTYWYGAQGRHGANYIQTAAASVAALAAMCMLIQAMVWLGMPLPEAWKLVLFFTCVGMFAIGVGMLYTPILVDRMQLEYPSGHAVANILRALSDPQLLRRSIAKLGGGTVVGGAVAALAQWVPALGATQISASNVGAGMVIGSRNTVPAPIYGALALLLVPTLRAHGWLGAEDPPRKFLFLPALAMILGAGLVDLTLVGFEAARRLRQGGRARHDDTPSAVSDGDPRAGNFSARTLVLWCAGWAAALTVVSVVVLHQPVIWMLLAIGLAVLFVGVNGISTGITDGNPISSAFVLAVLLMSGLGLRQPGVALIAASVLMLSCSVGVDMQQDRSTGWRLGTNRRTQFRYQVVGITMGAIMCVVLAKLFMAAYPALTVDVYSNPKAQTGAWQSAMTFKVVGAIRDLGHLPTYKLVALGVGLVLGLVIEIARKVVHRSPRYRAYIANGRKGFAFGWLMDTVLLPSPYASSFGGFVDIQATLWFGLGGVLAAVVGWGEKRRRAAAGAGAQALPEDMGTPSLVGGGLIAGESLFMLGLGIWGLTALL